MNKQAGKVAIVTGASKGIGAALAKGLPAAGAAVTLNYSSDKEGGDRRVADLTGKGGKAIAIRADVSKSSDVKRLFEETKKAFGSVDMLLNNARVFEFGPLEAVTENEFHGEFDTNVLGPFLAIQEARKCFPSNGGSIFNISSIASETPVPNSSLHVATKGALDTITMALAKELGPERSASTLSLPATRIPRELNGLALSRANRPRRWFRPLSWRPNLGNRWKLLLSGYSSPRTTLHG